MVWDRHVRKPRESKTNIVVHNPGQLVILCPAGLQIFPKRDALGLTRKWALRNNKWDVIMKTGQ